MKNITVATRVAIAIMLVAVGALAATLIYGAVTRDDLSRSAIEARAVGSSTAKADELSRYLDSVNSGALQLASSEMTIDAAQRFVSTYKELPSPDTLSEDQQGSLLALYRDAFLPSLETARGHKVAPGSVMPSTDPALYLQTVYFQAAVDDEVDPTFIDDALDGSSWSEVHRELHTTLRDSASGLGFDDMFIIDPESGAIVYSAAKKSDFGTSLEIGPEGGSAVSSILDSIVGNPVPGTVTVADFSRYNPDLAAPRAFVGTPILDGDTLVAVLVAKISPDAISRITTQDSNWSAMQLGETGEIFIVGADGLMRSDSRMFVEEPDEYLTAATDAGTLEPQDVNGVNSAGTTVIFQRMGAATHDAIKQADDEMVESKNYLNRDVFTAVQSVENPFGDWTLVLQIETDEALDTSTNARAASAVAVALFVLVLTFVASMWSETFVRPIRVLSMRLHALVGGASGSGSPEELANEPTRTTREFSNLTDTIDEMLESLADREKAAALLETERRNVVKRFLPGDVALRIESGDRSIEHVEHATVVSVVVGGIGRLDSGGSQDVIRDRVEELIDSLDQSASRRGLRRVKVVGDAWVAVCGIDTPHVDHIARSVRVALDAIEPGFDLDNDGNGRDAAVGIATGPVSAGLAGSDHLMYDAWGPTVTEASLLARTAKPGTILVSEAVVNQMPTDIKVTELTNEVTSRAEWSIDLDETDTESRR